MWTINATNRPGTVLGLLGALAMAAFGSGALATDDAPVTLYETQHLGYGQQPYFYSTYGVDVAIDGNALMVADNSFEDLDSVVSFRRAQDASWGDRAHFAGGVSADIEGQRALVGNDYKCWDDQDWMDCANGYGIGAVGYFEQASDGRWYSVGEPIRPRAIDIVNFGRKVDLSGSKLAATASTLDTHASSAVLIFERRNGIWEEVYEIRFEAWAASIALDGDTLLIGEPKYGSGSGGIVHMYRLNARGRWRPRGTFAPADLHPDAAFGSSVALDGNRAVVGAPGAGSAYVFERGTSSGVWRERARLEAEPASAAWEFGSSVALDGDIAIVGRPENRRGINDEVGAGSAHVFVRESRSHWTRQAVLISSDGAPRNAFGAALAIDGADVVVGAPNLADTGAAYYFDLSVLADEPHFVDIDVKPGSDDNLLDPDDTGTVWVAILSSMDFDALQVDPATVAFGPESARPDRDRVDDINGDGLADLKLRFAIPDIGLSCDATTLQLTGTTYAGKAIFGQETMQVIGCDEIVVKVQPLTADRGLVDLVEPSFYVFVLSGPGFDPANVNTADLRIDEFGGAPRGVSYRDLNGDGVPDLRLRFKTEEVQLDCGDHDITVDVYIMAEGDPYFDDRTGTLRITLIGC